MQREPTDAARGWAPAGATPPAGDRGSPRGSVALVAVMVGLVVLAGSAVGTFALAGGFGGGAGQPVACGPGQWCLPSLTNVAVVDTVTAQGFECTKGIVPGHWQCVLDGFDFRYDVDLGPSTDDLTLIADVRLQAEFPGESGPSRGAKPFLEWFVTLPYAADPAAAAEVTAWLEERLAAGEGARAVIGGYEYDLKVSDPGRPTGEIELFFQGVGGA